MSGKLNAKYQPSSLQLQGRFRQLASESKKSRELVDRVEKMGQAVMSLDGTDFDLDPAEDSVAVEQNGLIGFATGVKDLDLVFSLDVLDERGAESKEYSKEMTLVALPDTWGNTYRIVSESQSEVVVEDNNGLLSYRSTDSRPD